MQKLNSHSQITFAYLSTDARSIFIFVSYLLFLFACSAGGFTLFLGEFERFDILVCSRSSQSTRTLYFRALLVTTDGLYVNKYIGIALLELTGAHWLPKEGFGYGSQEDRMWARMQGQKYKF